jgi:hypothetical protein
VLWAQSRKQGIVKRLSQNETLSHWRPLRSLISIVILSGGKGLARESFPESKDLLMFAAAIIPGDHRSVELSFGRKAGPSTTLTIR